MVRSMQTLQYWQGHLKHVIILQFILTSTSIPEATIKTLISSLVSLSLSSKCIINARQFLLTLIQIVLFISSYQITTNTQQIFKRL